MTTTTPASIIDRIDPEGAHTAWTAYEAGLEANALARQNLRFIILTEAHSRGLWDWETAVTGGGNMEASASAHQRTEDTRFAWFTVEMDPDGPVYFQGDAC